MQMAIKVADVGHLAACFPVHYRWVKCLEEEFFMQGDREAAADMPITRFMDRSQAGVSKSQVSGAGYHSSLSFLNLYRVLSWHCVLRPERPLPCQARYCLGCHHTKLPAQPAGALTCVVLADWLL